MQQIIRVNRQGHKFRSNIILMGLPRKGGGGGWGVTYCNVSCFDILFKSKLYTIGPEMFVYLFQTFHFITLQGRCGTTNDHK